MSPFSESKLKGTVLQGYEESCGAAALASIMTLYGRETTEMEIIDKISKTDMLSFAQMARVAGEFGFMAAGYSLEPEQFEKLTLPVIVRIDNREEFSHFVVVTNHDGDFVSIFDPSFGYYIEHKKAFFDWWSKDGRGVVLAVLPKDMKKIPNVKLELPSRGLFLK